MRPHDAGYAAKGLKVANGPEVDAAPEHGRLNRSAFMELVRALPPSMPKPDPRPRRRKRRY